MQQTKARSIQTGNVPAVVAGLPIVNTGHGGHGIGLYPVKQVYARAMVLNHGAISFPVGTLLDVVDFLRLIPHSVSLRLSPLLSAITATASGWLGDGLAFLTAAQKATMKQSKRSQKNERPELMSS
ncbi:MAG: hypothetical protein A2580_00790 [Hydrogenophilales bacterium RIFOXYD1_FULL_62_11]|nr:MAG: hypothetical protein A2580_00790 [Hydrogenophilales bacterium RIFOXYD1_FULL_62_11]